MARRQTGNFLLGNFLTSARNNWRSKREELQALLDFKQRELKANDLLPHDRSRLEEECEELDEDVKFFAQFSENVLQRRDLAKQNAKNHKNIQDPTERILRLLLEEFNYRNTDETLCLGLFNTKKIDELIQSLRVESTSLEKRHKETGEVRIKQSVDCLNSIIRDVKTFSRGLWWETEKG